MKLSKITFVVLLLSLIHFSGCGVYSFTGASISPNIKTISIQTFYNNAPLGPSTMSVTFTEKIKDYFQQNTSLVLVEDNGDLQIEGYIADYTVAPVSANASGNDNQVDFSNQSRITITVFASYVNTQDDEFNFERRFSFFQDHDNSQDLSANEQRYSEIIFDNIILDIFNASVANW